MFSQLGASESTLVWKTEATSLLFLPTLVTVQCNYYKSTSASSSSYNGDSAESNLNDIVRCEIRGPSNRWFAIGLGGQFMPGTYGIIVDVNGNVFEEILGPYIRGVPIPKMVNVLSSKVKKGIRTIVFERKADGGDDRYTFPSIIGSSIIAIAAEGPIASYYRNSVHITRSDYGVDAPKIVTKSVSRLRR